MNNIKKVPDSWMTVRVKDISLKIQYGYTTSSQQIDTGIRLLRITDIQNYSVDWNTVPFCEIDESDLEKYQLSEHDLVFARTGATVGKSFLIQGSIPKSIFASYLIRIKLSQKINSKYIFYFFQSADYWRQIGIKAMGIGQPNVNASSLSNILVPICSLAEQNTIVDLIETYFGLLEAGIRSLDTARKLLKAYEFVILKNAFEGKLTSKWRALNREIFATQSTQTETSSIVGEIRHELESNGEENFSMASEVPGWTGARLGDLVTIAARVGWKGLKREEYTSQGPLFLSVHALNHGKRVNFERTNHISLERYDESPEIKLRVDDILLCKDGAGIGKVAIVKNLPGEATINSSLIIIRGGDIFEADFLYYLFKGPKMQRLVSDRVSGSAIPHLFQRDIKELILDVPPKIEQLQIVEEIESRLELVDDLVLTISDTQNKLEKMKMVLLDKAYSGRLSQPDNGGGSVDQMINEIASEKADLSNVREVLSDRPHKTRKSMDKPKSIIELLNSSKMPIPAKELWLSSVHKDDIEGFYSELRSMQDRIVEIKRETDSLLSLRNEDR